MVDVLVVEDEKELGEVLCDFLKKEGYITAHVRTGEEALSFISESRVRLVLLDIMLPGLDGFHVCRKIREEDNVPIVVLSARVEKDDKLNALLLGADDYMEKPYDIDILLAKIRAVFRRNYEEGEKPGTLTVANLKADLKGRRVFLSEKELELTAKEYELLTLLMEHQGKVLKKEWIFNRIWGVDSFSEPSTLTVHIKWLREKIEANPKQPEHILTVWGVGYKMV